MSTLQDDLDRAGKACIAFWELLLTHVPKPEGFIWWLTMAAIILTLGYCFAVAIIMITS